MTTITADRGRLTGGQLRTRCDWSQPTVVAHSQTTTHADIDALMPAIGEHIDQTGHPVRMALLTLRTNDVEETDLTFHPQDVS
jgi:hypothetical protein